MSAEDRRWQELFQELLETSDESAEAVGARSEATDELNEMLFLTQQLQSLGQRQMPDADAALARAQERVLQSIPAAVPERGFTLPPIQPPFWQRWRLALASAMEWSPTPLIAALTIALVLGLVIFAADSARPGSPLYRVKVVADEIMLRLAPSEPDNEQQIVVQATRKSPTEQLPEPTDEVVAGATPESKASPAQQPIVVTQPPANAGPGESPSNGGEKQPPQKQKTKPASTPVPSPTRRVATPAASATSVVVIVVPTKSPTLSTVTATGGMTPAPTSSPGIVATGGEASPTITASPSTTLTPTVKSTMVMAVTGTAVISKTATSTPGPTVIVTESMTPTASPTVMETPSPVATVTPSPTSTPMPTATNSPTLAPSNTPTATATPVIFVTATPTVTFTPVVFITATPTATRKPTRTPAPTATPTKRRPTNTPTAAPIATRKPTRTPAPTATPTTRRPTRPPKPTDTPVKPTVTPVPTATPAPNSSSTDEDGTHVTVVHTATPTATVKLESISGVIYGVRWKNGKVIGFYISRRYIRVTKTTAVKGEIAAGRKATVSYYTKKKRHYAVSIVVAGADKSGIGREYHTIAGTIGRVRKVRGRVVGFYLGGRYIRVTSKTDVTGKIVSRKKAVIKYYMKKRRRYAVEVVVQGASERKSVKKTPTPKPRATTPAIKPTRTPKSTSKPRTPSNAPVRRATVTPAG